MTNATRITKPGGLWLLELWNVRSIIATVMGSHWHEYNPPSVMHWFSFRSAKAICEQFGMKIIARGRPQKWIYGSHFKSAVIHNFGSGILGGLAKSCTRMVPDELAIPYPCDDVFWMICRKLS